MTTTITDQIIDLLRRSIVEVEASDGRLVFVRLTTGEARGLVAELVRLRDQVADAVAWKGEDALRLLRAEDRLDDELRKP